MEEFSEEEVEQIIQKALSETDSANPMVPNGIHLGIGEPDILSEIHERLSKKIIESELNEIFADVRGEINSSRYRISLKEIHTITRNCKKCSIESTAELPKWNVENPDVAVVIDSPNLPQEGISVMLEAFKNAGFKSEQLCLTYVNRCPVQRKYEPQEVQNCAPYLHTELVCMNPKLIICLGSIPAASLFGEAIKIKDYRGDITWLGSWPIMPTYSPLYVLRSGEAAKNMLFNDIQTAKNFVSQEK